MDSDWSPKNRRRLMRLATALALVLPIAAGCGERHCRKIAAVYSTANQTLPAIGAPAPSGVPTSCAFDPAQVTNRCETKSSLVDPSTGASTDETRTTVTQWRSLSDFLSAGVPIGQVKTASFTDSVPTPGMGAPCVLMAAYQYDQQGRPQAVVSSGSPECITPTSSAIEGSSTYDAWDALGRYTHGSTSFGTTPCAFNRTIDDATNTIVNVTVASPSCGVVSTTTHYDADGIFMDSTRVSETQTATQTITVSQTEEVCD
jgi:hypothetical protein